MVCRYSRHFLLHFEDAEIFSETTDGVFARASDACIGPAEASGAFQPHFA